MRSDHDDNREHVEYGDRTQDRAHKNGSLEVNRT